LQLIGAFYIFKKVQVPLSCKARILWYSDGIVSKREQTTTKPAMTKSQLSEAKTDKDIEDFYIDLSQEDRANYLTTGSYPREAHDRQQLLGDEEEDLIPGIA
jgi:hypothetical protein